MKASIIKTTLLTALISFVTIACNCSSGKLEATEFGFRFGAGFSDFAKGKYDLRLTSSGDVEALERDIVSDAVIDTFRVQLSTVTTISSDFRNETGLFAGFYGRYNLKSKEDITELTTNKINLVGELNWERISAKVNFGRNITSQLYSAYDTTIEQISSVQSALDAVTTALADTIRQPFSNLTLDYIQIPVMFELQRVYDNSSADYSMETAYLHFGPALKYCVTSRETVSSKITDSVSQLYDSYGFSIESSSDDTYMQIISREVDSTIHKLSSDIRSITYSFIIGCGLQVKDVFKTGFGSDQFSIDLRADLGIYDINEAAVQPFRINALFLSLGYMF